MMTRFKRLIACSLALGLFTTMARAEVALPADYTQLDWIQSTGKQYVDARYVLKSTDVIDARVRVDFDQPAYAVLFGASEASTGNPIYMFQIALSSAGSYQYCRAKGGAVKGTNVAFYNQIVDIHCSGAEMNWRPKDAEVPTETLTATASVSSDGKRNFMIFCFNQGGKADCLSAARLYSFVISTPDGDIVRSYIPCRNPNGQAGLWETVVGEFIPNSGTGKFLGSDDPAPDRDVRLTSITFTGSQYINTGYQFKAYDVFALDLIANATGQNLYANFFGSRGSSNTDHAALVFATRNGAYHTQTWRSGKSYEDANNAKGFPYGKRTTLTLTEDTLSWTPADGSAGSGYELLTQSQSEPEGAASNRPLIVFACNDTGKASVPAAAILAGTFYSFKVTDSETVDQLNLVPYRKQDGTICVYDTVNDKPIAISGTGVRGGAAVSDAEGVRTFYDGSIDDEDLRGFTSFVKDSPYQLNATAVSSFPGDLVVRQGSVSFVDSAAKTISVNGTLDLKGGVRLDLEVLANGNDCLVPTGVVVDATVENPVRISLTPVQMSELDTARTLISGGLKQEDLAKFKVTSALPVRLSVTDAGELVVEPKTVGEFVWTGAAQDGGLWATAANWENAELPENGGKLVFGLAAGGATQFDGPFGLSVESVTATATAGAFTHGGGALGVTKSLVNDSSAGQTFLMPMTLGVVGGVFSFAATGDLTLTDGDKTTAAAEFVKTGEGTLTINDDAVAAASTVRVEAGTLKLVNTLKTTSASTAGEIRISNGARLDVNVDAAQAASLARTEVTHGKTVYVEGAGPDGLGALVNSVDAANWGCTFGRLVLTGDAASGGKGVLSVRQLPYSCIPGAAFEGPGTLFVKGPGQFALDTASCEVGGIRVEDGGYLQFQGSISGTVTNGVTLLNGSFLRFWGGSIPTEVPINVPAEASARLAVASESASISGQLRVDGQLALEKAANNISLNLKGTLAGNGALSGAGLLFSGTASCWQLAMDRSGFVEKVDYSGLTDRQAFLTSIKKIKIVYVDTSAGLLRYKVGPASGLTDEQAASIQVEATNGDKSLPGWTARVINENLCLINPQPRGLTIVFR